MIEQQKHDRQTAVSKYHHIGLFGSEHLPHQIFCLLNAVKPAVVAAVCSVLGM